MQTQTLAPPEAQFDLTIARIRAAKARPFRCVDCGRDCVSYALVGATPRRCHSCNPSMFRALVEEVLRADLAAERGRVAELQAQLAQETGGHADFKRAASCGEPGRDSLARAVRRLAHTTGVADTVEALLTISAVARAWAARLGMKVAEDDQ